MPNAKPRKVAETFTKPKMDNTPGQPVISFDKEVDYVMVSHTTGSGGGDDTKTKTDDDTTPPNTFEDEVEIKNAVCYIMEYLLRIDEIFDKDNVLPVVSRLVSVIHTTAWQGKTDNIIDFDTQTPVSFRCPRDVIDDLWSLIFTTTPKDQETIDMLAEIMIKVERKPRPNSNNNIVCFHTVAQVVFCFVRSLNMGKVTWDTAEHVKENCSVLLEAQRAIEEKYQSTLMADHWYDQKVQSTLVVGNSERRRQWASFCNNSRIAIGWTRGPKLLERSCFTVIHFESHKLMITCQNTCKTQCQAYFRKIFRNWVKPSFLRHQI